MNRQRLRLRAWGGVGVGILLLALGLRWFKWSRHEEPEEGIDFRHRFQGGALIISGGGRLPPEIRQRFVELAGGNVARLVIIPAYEANSKQVSDLGAVWRQFGVQNITVLQAVSRDQADGKSFSEPLKKATAVWFSGGQQEWLSQHYADTPVEQELKQLLKRGGVIGGSSAGAAIMTKMMIEQGSDSATLGIGLDLLPGAIVDQHFLKRSRLNRLIGVLKAHPNVIGFGIDEGTALVVQVEKGRLAVLGDSYVIAYLPTSEAGHRRFEAMKRGDQIDLDSLRSGKARISSPHTFEDWLSDD